MKESATREMTAHGQIREFHRNLESWTSYMEQIECYFIANAVANARKKRAILLSCCGASMYSLIWSLAVPSKPTDVAYKELLKNARHTLSQDAPGYSQDTSLTHIHSPLQHMCLSYGNLRIL